MTTETGEIDAQEGSDDSATTGTGEIDALVGSDDSTLTLTTGREVRIESLRTRQMLRLIKVFTRGAGPLIAEMNFSSGTSTDEFVGQLVGAFVFAIPEAEDETIDFVLGLAVPTDAPKMERGMSKQAKKDRQEAIDSYFEEMEFDPDMRDTLAILSTVIKREAPNLRALGNQIAALLPTAMKVEKKTPAPKKRAASLPKT